MAIRFLSYYQVLYNLTHGLGDVIQAFLKHEHAGENNAVHMESVFEFARLFDPNISDRDIRKAYEMVDKCWSKKGLYYPTKNDIQKEIEKIDGTIIHFAEKKRKLERLGERLKNTQLELPL